MAQIKSKITKSPLTIRYWSGVPILYECSLSFRSFAEQNLIAAAVPHYLDTSNWLLIIIQALIIIIYYSYNNQQYKFMANHHEIYFSLSLRRLSNRRDAEDTLNFPFFLNTHSSIHLHHLNGNGQSLYPILYLSVSQPAIQLVTHSKWMVLHWLPASLHLNTSSAAAVPSTSNHQSQSQLSSRGAKPSPWSRTCDRRSVIEIFPVFGRVSVTTLDYFEWS